jgi:glycosyltransferase involved in cell wall biosynthesis
MDSPIRSVAAAGPTELQVNYVVISPVRNEDAHLDEVIEAIAAQTVRPTAWVLVDDGSTDSTPVILKRAAMRYPWISIVSRPDRGSRAPGSGVIEAFYDGYATVSQTNWEYLVKFDGDMVAPSDYMQKCFEQFGADPSLGIGGGTVTHLEHGEAKVEPHPQFHVRGATKIYRRACWQAIGGLIRSPGWDTLDELYAHFTGWTTRTFPSVCIYHRRPTGAADGTWRNSVKNGLANYVVGYHPIFMAVKCLKRAWEHPLSVEAVGLGYGFARGYVRRIPRVSNSALVAYVRREQLRRLTFRSSMWQ